MESRFQERFVFQDGHVEIVVLDVVDADVNGPLRYPEISYVDGHYLEEVFVQYGIRKWRGYLKDEVFESESDVKI